MIRSVHCKLGPSSQDYYKRFYRKHFQGALVRVGASLIMWMFALVAYIIDVIGPSNFLGVSLGVFFLIVINPPTLYILKNIKHRNLAANFSTFINLLEIAGYTVVMYSMGGIEATYLTLIYAALIAYVGAMTDRWRTFLIAGTCSGAYTVMVLLEGAGVIPWHRVNVHFTITWPSRLVYLSVVVTLLFVIAYIASYTAALRKKSRDDLRAAQRDLENRVAERTAELKRVNKERIEYEAKLHRAQKMEALGMLAGGVAHDLNNILSGIVSFPELLLMDLPSESPLREPIELIKKSGEKAAAIVQDLLNLARRSVVTKEIVNLNTIVRDYIVSPEHGKLKQYHPRCLLEINCQPGLMNIEGAPFQLSKSLMNLVSNAFEAMPEGGHAVLTTQNCYIDRNMGDFENVTEGEYVLLTVADAGMGISPEDRERIFEPFFTKKALGRSGTGLGMAVVWGVVKDLKGFIDVQSTLGAGTTFQLYIPASRQELPTQVAKPHLVELQGQGQSILVVDDVEVQRQIACEMLKKLGYAVTAVASGEEALDYLQNNTVDLMIIDMIMDPGMNGLETFQAVRKIRLHQKAIIASGFSETESVTTALQLGAGAYVRKPYSIEQIGQPVRDILGQPPDKVSMQADEAPAMYDN
jgi:signal transduction histidine kinase/ActR/RegA family two-component response regulator